jgi:dTDP-4-dehydrorhamnose reductase
MPLGNVLALTKRDLDLTDLHALAGVVQRYRPKVIVNSAAYTAVDAAEADEATALQVNAAAVETIAKEARNIGATVVHYSTDYVFDGTAEAPYSEWAATNPLNAYGRSKLAGEEALRQSGCRHLILRTSWVYASRGKNFLKTILRLARERTELKIVSDQHGAPTWARNIADATAHILRQEMERPFEHALSGTFHLVAEGETSWYGFAAAVLEELTKRESGWKPPKLVPISAADYPTPALRPKNSRLNSSALKARYGLFLPHWRIALERCLEDFLP